MISGKAKLPKHLSFPVGAEAISSALEGIPYASELKLTFLADSYPKREFDTALREDRPYQLLKCSFYPKQSPGYSGSNKSVEQGWYDEKWQFWIYPVLRVRRHVANQLLIARGLPWIAIWMRESERPGWRMHQHHLELRFDPAAGILTQHITDRA
jgi:hypothetical protein